MTPFSRYVKIFLLLIVLYLLTALLSCLLPNRVIRQNISDSVEDFIRETDYPQAILQGHGYQMDNFTDALILNIAYTTDVHDLRNSMLDPKFACEGPVMSTNLQHLVDGSLDRYVSYGRYWHASAFLIRFPLLLGNYNSIRYWVYILTSLLLLSTCFILYKKVGPMLTLGYFSGFVLLNGFITQFSVQFAVDIILALVFTMLVCRFYPKSKNMALLMFINGSVTCWLDLLTTPVLTLGMPMLAYIMLMRREWTGLRWREPVRQLAVPSLLWGGAYLLTWFSKWILTTLFTSDNVLRDGLNQVLIRVGTGEDFNRWSALVENVKLLPVWAILLWLLLIAVPVVLAFRKKYSKSVLLLIPFMLLPYVWYLFAANHSYIHCWFTYRNQMLTVSALSIALLLMADFRTAQKKCSQVFKKRKK